MDMLYRAPFAAVITFEEAKPCGANLYHVIVNQWRNKSSNGNLQDFARRYFCFSKWPKNISDLQRAGMSWDFLSLIDLRGDRGTKFKVNAIKKLELVNIPK
ncbi:LOW QUALITY PROTEIN: hypothetical protein TorRG33x02_169330 [Trema orientale]|uniref:DUF6469 domain-containing protein n=1 Tax=Trema orientale TaxID=63057 RepID=A0A2P5EP23_TREOI|nr:LOW QUALITY PROTEIN: hypothetical protein TorRG33x02_169330 [Trema orientale]